jgi:AraC-like DNA-binding protein
MSVLVPARYYLLLLPLMRGHGVEPTRLLAELGLDPARLAHPAAQLGSHQVEALVSAALALDPRADLALQLGRRIKPSSHEIVGLAMLSADTLADSLRLAERYWSLISPLLHLRSTATPQGLQLRWQPALPLSAAVARFHAEATLAAVHAELAFFLGQVPPGCVFELPRRWTGERERYRLLRPASVRSHDDIDDWFAVWLPRAVLGRPLALADPAARATAESRCQAMLDQLSAEGGLTSWVLQILQHADDHFPGQLEVARLLRLSSRSLHRRLAGEGTSFRDLSNAERHRRACAALEHTRAAISSIALGLGYRDAANFSRAFRQRAGVAPLRYRQLARSAAAD